MNQRREFTDRGKSLIFDRVTEASSKAHGTEHAQLVFCKALMGLADGANDAAIQVFAPTHIVQHLAGIGIEEKAVDGEIAALHVHARVFRELHFVRMAAVRISTVTAEGWHFNGVIVAPAFSLIANITPLK